MSEIPLFLFGVLVTLLVVIGVVLAILEFRQSHVPMEQSESAEPPAPSSG